MTDNKITAACSRCQFSVLSKKPPPEIGDMRVCKLFPPMTHMIPMQAGKGQIGISAMMAFPQVTDDTWCYQFAALPENPN